jgi:hypothetical protein
MRLLLLMAVLGLTGCAVPVSDSAICAGLDRPVSELRGALIANPDTPELVGEAGTDVVLGFEAGCGQ